MGVYDNITILGIDGVKVLAANCEGVLEKYVTDFIDVVQRSEAKVVGVDLKQVQSKGNNKELLVMFSGSCSLVFDVNYSQNIPDSFIRFVKDDNICFVAATDAVKNLTLSHSYISGGYRQVDDKFDIPCVLVGDLAVMVLKKAGINKLSMAEVLGGIVGVSYDKKPASNSTSEIIHLDLVNPLVFTAGKIESVISDACACYQIGYKLLSSL